jgi:ABC-type Zn uptake system ZnuABC Zn-binding protein ZnuA
MWSWRIAITWLWLAGGVWTAGWLAQAPWASGATEPGAPVDVVVTIPVLRDLVERVGAGHVRVVSLLSGLESEHTYSPRPSDLVAVRKARVLFEIGIGLEVWASSLVKAASNAQLKVVTTSRGIALIRDPGGPDPATPVGLDEHSGGNPHVWLDPANAKVMLRHITDTLIGIDPAHASDYRANQAAYLRELDVAQSDLVQRVKPLKDRRVIVHHPAWPYFARRFGFIVAGEIVSQPGAEPSAQRLQSLVARMRRDKIKVIVSEPQLNQKLPDTLARETGARVVVLTPLPGGLPGTDTYLDMLRFNVHQLARALE